MYVKTKLWWLSITYLYMQSCFIKGYCYGEDEDISWFNADIYMIDVKNQVYIYIISLCKHFTNDTFFQLREQ